MKQITKNPADDCSFKELGNMIKQHFYLGRGVERREKQREELLEKIKSEVKRLQEIGYDMSKLDIIPIESFEL